MGLESISVDTASIAQLEREVIAALESGSAGHLRVLGYGEISLVVELEHDGRSYACKRLPEFSSQARLEAYRGVLDRYIERLREHGVRVAPTALVALPRGGGRYVAYCIQPKLERETLGPNYLKRCSLEEAEQLWRKLLGRIQACVGSDLGLDAQLSNWALREGELVYLDITTPFMRDRDHNELLDTELFMSSIPSLLRAPVRLFFFKSIFDKYYDARGIVLDFLGNLVKEGLEYLMGPFVARANQVLQVPLTYDEIGRYYREDARMWAIIQRLRRVDRFIHHNVRRRPYGNLLPPAIERNVRVI